MNGADYCCIINRISKSDAVNALQNTDFTEKKEHYKDKKNIKNILSYIKWVKKL